ncbi:MAG: hypothetical protein DRO12_05185 [Thermoprotei archaeon]|nr:MAG: hypothetical protein DRO12_05185 [Thermoprotei archaeon]
MKVKLKIKPFLILLLISILPVIAYAETGAWVVYINSYDDYQKVKIEGSFQVELSYTFDNGRLVINSICLSGSSVRIDFTWYGSRSYPYLGISQSNGNHGYVLHDSTITEGHHVLTLRLVESVSTYPYLHFYKTCIPRTGGPIIATIDMRNIPSCSQSTPSPSPTQTTTVTTTTTTTATITVTTTAWYEGIKNELQAIFSGFSSPSSNTSVVIAVALVGIAVIAVAVIATRKR